MAIFSAVKHLALHLQFEIGPYGQNSRKLLVERLTIRGVHYMTLRYGSVRPTLISKQQLEKKQQSIVQQCALLSVHHKARPYVLLVIRAHPSLSKYNCDSSICS